MQFDLLVIGGGSGGVRAARKAAEKGFKVAIAEKRHWGGTCVNAGCVPKKLLVIAAEFGDATLASSYGWESRDLRPNWSLLRDRITAKTRQLAGLYKKVLADAGVHTVEAEAQFLSDKEVLLDKKVCRAKTVLIATGGKPRIPEIPGHEFILTSDDMFRLERLPRSMVIVGGGYIALEFACILSALGIEVFLVYRAERLLTEFDAELSLFVAEQMPQKIHRLPNTNVLSVSRNGERGVKVQISQQTGAEAETSAGNTNTERSICADSVLFAIGRIPNTASLRLEKAGIALTDSGAIRVHTNFQTSVPNIFALGDVTDNLSLTPVAIAEAEIFVRQRFGKEKVSAGYIRTETASAVFCKPEVATLGLSAEQAESQHGTENVGSLMKNITSLRYSLAANPVRSFIKIVYHKKDHTVLGIHLAGEHVSEIMQGFAVVFGKGMRLEDLNKTIAIHPTLAEELVTF